MTSNRNNFRSNFPRHFPHKRITGGRLGGGDGAHGFDRRFCGADNDVGGGGSGPLAVRVEGRKDVNAAKNGKRRSDFDGFDFFDDALDDDGDVFGALLEEAGGAGVAVEGKVADLVIVTDAVWVTPFDEVGFDEFAVGMAADLAFAAVAVERSGGDVLIEFAPPAAGSAAGGGFELGVEGFDPGDVFAKAGFGIGWLACPSDSLRIFGPVARAFEGDLVLGFGHTGRAG